jgi:hypothetical protein
MIESNLVYNTGISGGATVALKLNKISKKKDF